MIDPTTVRLSDLPSLAIAYVHNAPSIAAVYLVAVSEPEVLYVGRAANLARRWRTHHRKEQVTRVAQARLFWLPVDSPEEARVLENSLIRRFQPSLNWTEHPISESRMSTIAVRVPRHVAEFYEELARRERRKLSDTIRLVLTAYAERGN